MIWHNSGALYLLLLLPALVAIALLGLRQRQRSMQRFGQGAGPSMVRGAAPGLRLTKAVLGLLAVALAIIALARPQYGSRTRMLRKRGVDIVVALDFSKSMLARDVKPNRIARAKAELTRFISELGGDRVGLVAFAGDTMEFPMTVDYAAAALFIRDMEPADMPVGGTAIGRALVAAKRLLERAKVSAKGPVDDDTRQTRERVVILFTDGEDHEGEPVEAAKELKEIGARVYVVGIGSRSGEMIPTYADDGTWTGYLRDEDGNPVLTQMTQENESVLKQVAELTGGKYIAAGRGRVGVDEIRGEIAHMKQTELQARRITIHEERYALVLLLAFVLLLLETIVPEGRVARDKEKAP